MTYSKIFFLFLACAVMILLFPIQASARYDPGLKWCTVQTDNFIIYYPKGHELLAQRVQLAGRRIAGAGRHALEHLGVVGGRERCRHHQGRQAQREQGVQAAGHGAHGSGSQAAARTGTARMQDSAHPCQRI